MDVSNMVCLDVETYFSIEDITLKRGYAPGLRLAGIYEWATSQYHPFTPNNLDGCAYLLEQATLIVGWNILYFDFPVMKQHIDMKPYYKKVFDIMDFLAKKTKQKLTLHNVSMATLMMGKIWRKETGETLEAWEDLLKYNERDAQLPIWLMVFGMTYGFISYEDPKQGGKRDVEVKW